MVTISMLSSFVLIGRFKDKRGRLETLWDNETFVVDWGKGLKFYCPSIPIVTENEMKKKINFFVYM